MYTKGHELLLKRVRRIYSMPTIYAINNVNYVRVFDLELGVDLTTNSNCQAVHDKLNVFTLPIDGRADGMDNHIIWFKGKRDKTCFLRCGLQQGFQSFVITFRKELLQGIVKG